MESCASYKRVRRMKRSKVLRFDCKGLKSPQIKWAETPGELEQAFALVHDEYLKLGYISQPDPSRMYYGIHNLLPETATLTVNSDSKVVATLTLVPDTKAYGLPMDKIYNTELNELRREGRKLSELCGLVTSSKLRWKNLYMQMCRIVYKHALCSGIDDFCIMVNPKHVEFYKTIFLFEKLGPEKLYPALGVPAVALRADLNKMKDQLSKNYGSLDCECNLYSFMHQSETQNNVAWLEDLRPPKETPLETMLHFNMEADAQSHLLKAAVGYI